LIEGLKKDMNVVKRELKNGVEAKKRLEKEKKKLSKKVKRSENEIKFHKTKSEKIVERVKYAVEKQNELNITGPVETAECHKPCIVTDGELSREKLRGIKAHIEKLKIEKEDTNERIMEVEGVIKQKNAENIKLLNEVESMKADILKLTQENEELKETNRQLGERVMDLEVELKDNELAYKETMHKLEVDMEEKNQRELLKQKNGV
jgi:chromosome segregation ATPase